MAFSKKRYLNFSTMVKVKAFRPSSFSAFWKTRCQKIFSHVEGKSIKTKQFLRLFGTVVKVKAFKMSNSKAFWKTRYQNFFTHGGGKGIQTKEF